MHPSCSVDLRPMKVEMSGKVEKKMASLIKAAHARALQREDGPVEELNKRFAYSRATDMPSILAVAVRQGLVDRSDISAEVWPHIEPWLAFFKDKEIEF